MSDAHVANHIVGQNFQQPHRVHIVAQFASEFLHVIARGGQEREEVVIVPVIPSTGTHEDSAPVVELCNSFRLEGLAVRGNSRLANGGAGGVEAIRSSRTNFGSLRPHQRVVVHACDLGGIWQAIGAHP
jgi:hypothetical protein